LQALFRVRTVIDGENSGKWEKVRGDVLWVSTGFFVRVIDMAVAL